MTSSPEMSVETSIIFLRFFIFRKCSLNLALRFRLVCPTYYIPQPCSLHVRTYMTYFEVIKQQFGGTKAYEQQMSADEKYVVNDHCCHTVLRLLLVLRNAKRDYMMVT